MKKIESIQMHYNLIKFSITIVEFYATKTKNYTICIIEHFLRKSNKLKKKTTTKAKLTNNATKNKNEKMN